MAQILSVNLENSLGKVSDVSEPSASKTKQKKTTEHCYTQALGGIQYRGLCTGIVPR
jgi:hypothetical protein